MEVLVWVLHQPVVRGALSGIATAAVVDLHAFLNWRDCHEFAQYDWGTAALRWAQGAVVGALTALGYQGLLGL